MAHACPVAVVRVLFLAPTFCLPKPVHRFIIIVHGINWTSCTFLMSLHILMLAVPRLPDPLRRTLTLTVSQESCGSALLPYEHYSLISANDPPPQLHRRLVPPRVLYITVKLPRPIVRVQPLSYISYPLSSC